MKNVKDLRDDLLETFDQLRSGEIGFQEAKVLCNLSGKICSSAKLQLEYNKYAHSKHKVKFLISED